MNDFISDKAEKTVKTKELATILGIAESTVRKYSLELEAAGIAFSKDGQGSRIFKEQDLKLFQSLIHAREEVGLSLTASADFVATQFKSEMYNISPSQNVQPLVEKENNNIQSQHEMERFIKKTIEEIASSMVSVKQFEDLSKQNKELGAELQIIKDKLDIAVEYIQKQEQEQSEHHDKKEKKSIWKRLFSN